MPIIPPLDINEGPRTIYIPPGRVDPPIVIDPDIEIILDQTPDNNVSHSIAGGLVHLSGNPIEITLTAEKLLPNHRLVLQISCPNLRDQAPEKIAPDADGKAVFEISGLIDQPVQYDFEFPAVGKVKSYTDYVFVVTLKIGEEYTDVNGDRHTTWMNIQGNNDVIRVLKGKLSPYELALLNEENSSFAAKYIQGGKFLTHLPNIRTVAPGQIMKLWYLSRWTQNHNARLHLQVRYDDGYWAQSNTTIKEDVELYASGLFEFSIEPDFWNAIPNSNWGNELRNHIKSFTFFLRDEAGYNQDEDDPQYDISDRVTFIVDDVYRERYYEFFYVNPLSGIDNIYLTGKSIRGLMTEKETARRPIPSGSGTKVAGVKNISVAKQRQWEINTGDKKQDEMLALEDFLSTPELWMVNPDNKSKVISVNMESGEFPLIDYDADIQNFPIKVTEAY